MPSNSFKHSVKTTSFDDRGQISRKQHDVFFSGRNEGKKKKLRFFSLIQKAATLASYQQEDLQDRRYV